MGHGCIDVIAIDVYEWDKTVKYYMIVYYRPSGQLWYIKQFEKSAYALSEKWKVERLFGQVIIQAWQIEISVIVAPNLYQLYKMKPKYLNRSANGHRYETHVDAPKGISFCRWCNRIVIRRMGSWWEHQDVNAFMINAIWGGGK